MDDPNGDYDWRWYNYSAGRGGDQLAQRAWAFCARRPPHYNRDPDEFVAVLMEIAQAAGTAISPRLTASHYP